MLYDQAQLTLACLEAAQAAGDPSFATVAGDTLAYVRRELSHADGGFFSAEDADSIPPEQAGRSDAVKTEGAFYVWSQPEIEHLFGDDAEVVRFRYGIEPDGNAPHDPHGEFTNLNLLYVARGVEDVARLSGRSAEAVTAVLDGARGRLFEARSARPRPHLDDKVLAGWNGLMIAAFARAARVTPLDEPGSVAAQETATRAARFLHDRLWDADRPVLLRRFRDGHADIDAYSEDYACVVWGLLDLFQAGGDPVWLDWARELQATQNRLFWDEEGGGWFSTTGDDPTVLLRLKEEYDGAEPSAGSVAVWNLLTLAHLSGGDEAREHGDRVERTLRRVALSAQVARVVPMMMAAASTYRSGVTLAHLSGGDEAREHGDRVERTLRRVALSAQVARVVPMMMAAASTYRSGVPQVIIVGARDATATAALHRVFTTFFLPGVVSLVVEPGAHQTAIAERLPWVGAMTRRDGITHPVSVSRFCVSGAGHRPRAVSRTTRCAGGAPVTDSAVRQLR